MGDNTGTEVKEQVLEGREAIGVGLVWQTLEGTVEIKQTCVPCEASGVEGACPKTAESTRGHCCSVWVQGAHKTGSCWGSNPGCIPPLKCSQHPLTFAFLSSYGPVDFFYPLWPLPLLSLSILEPLNVCPSLSRSH